MTKSKQINTTVKELQSQNELILRAAGEGIYGLDADGKTTFVLGLDLCPQVGHF